MSLRRRLLIVSVALVAAALMASDVAAYVALRSFLLSRADSDLLAASAPVYKTYGIAQSTPGGTTVALANGRVAEASYTLFDASGATVSQLDASRFGKPGLSPPSLPAVAKLQLNPLVVPAPNRLKTLLVPAIGGGFEYEVAAFPTSDGEIVVVGLPLLDVAATLGQLTEIEIGATAAVIALMAAVGTWLVRVGLRPLSRMEQTAAEIATGDLSRRVEPADGRTEVGRLGLALNRMLSAIEDAFTARQASEERLRRLVTDVSHELRTPLTSIRGYAELFRRGADRRPADLRRAMRGIEIEAERMGVLVDELLLLARLDEGQPLPTGSEDLASVASDAVDAARAAEPDRPIDLRAPGTAIVAADRDRLRQVLDNLLANVRVHTPRGSPATVSVEAAADRVTLSVTDSGPGVPVGARAHVFERFYRADPSRSRRSGGSGLGLAIVAAIARAYGGDVDLESNSGSGARFIVHFPAAQPFGASPKKAASAAPDVGAEDSP
jgi:two-component system, OmpR family, sensor kinase